MKAIIVERRGDYAALLCEDGTFVKTRCAGEIGETVELSAQIVPFPAKKHSRWVRGAVAAMLALALTGGTLGYMGGTASAYVSLDVEDSSIELAVNHFGRVIAVNALSDDAQELATRLAGEVRHRRAEDALEHTMKRLREEGYLGEAGAAVLAGITSDSARYKAELTQSVENAVGKDQALYVSEASRAEREQAMGEHRSAGRFAFERDHGMGFPGGAKQEAPSAAPQERSEQTAPALNASPIEQDAPAVGGENSTPPEPPQGEAPQNEPPQGEAPQSEPPQGEAPQGEPPQGEAPQGEPPQGEAPQGEPPQGEAPQNEPPQGEAPQNEPPQGEAPQNEPPQGEAPQSEPPQGEAPQNEPPQGEAPQSEPPQGEAPQGEPRQGEAPQGEPPQGEAPQGEPRQGEAPQGEPPQDGAPSRQERGDTPSGGERGPGGPGGDARR